MFTNIYLNKHNCKLHNSFIDNSLQVRYKRERKKALQNVQGPKQSGQRDNCVPPTSTSAIIQHSSTSAMMLPGPSTSKATVLFVDGVRVHVSDYKEANNERQTNTETNEDVENNTQYTSS